jgi:murein DD-endopeptidase MepM/ murein hydrolase activator NlpD
MALSFTAAFFYQRHERISAKTEIMHEVNRTLEIELARKQPASLAPVSDVDQQRLDALQDEYAQSIANITAELNQLYALEADIRTQTKLEPRRDKINQAVASSEGGRGGSTMSFPSTEMTDVPDILRPESVIEGLAQPSADQLLREIKVRIESYRDLSAALQTQQQNLERKPSTWPVNGRKTSSFGYRKDPFTSRLSKHSGLDLAAPTGTPVRTTAFGKVVSSTYDREYGNMVKIDHGGGIETLYAHLSERLVKTGDKVNRGDLIGKVGSTGRSTGPHLHYEVRVNGNPVNPTQYLGGD